MALGDKVMLIYFYVSLIPFYFLSRFTKYFSVVHLIDKVQRDFFMVRIWYLVDWNLEGKNRKLGRRV